MIRLIRRNTYIRGYGRDRKGATAVEFALIAGPLILMILACLELALVVLVSVSLENAVETSARKIRTDNMAGITSAQTFREDICGRMDWLSGSCMDNLHVDVRTFTSFASAATPPALIVDGKLLDPMAYQVGNGGAIQLVRAYYTWDLLTPFLKGGLSSLESGQVALSTTAIFRNEPFER
ncbi:MAG: TadE/TadG family type IV pilus assembly protein [Asticcacaulis sp.]